MVILCSLACLCAASGCIERNKVLIYQLREGVQMVMDHFPKNCSELLPIKAQLDAVEEQLWQITKS